LIASYPWADAEEYAFAFDQGRDARLLIVPALFEEASRMRRLTIEVMRRLDLAGIDCFLPDLPGCNESFVSLGDMTPEGWRQAMATAANHFRATHVLGIRGGALLTPSAFPGWHYAPAKGASLLRQMVRARILVAREAGINETQDGLMAEGAQSGLELAGYRLSAEFLTQFQALGADSSKVIEQDTIGSGGLWLRAEPDEDRHQADALAAILAIGIKA
jgi:pimeloyl-ACP methyl ester carboxylesterase